MDEVITFIVQNKWWLAALSPVVIVLIVVKLLNPN